MEVRDRQDALDSAASVVGHPEPLGVLRGQEKTRRIETPGRARATALVHAARLVPAALWLGGAAFFSFAVAPSAFAVLPTRDLAGAVVARTLAVVNVGGFVVGLLLLLTWPVGRALVRRAARIAEAAALAVVTLTSAVGHWVVAARMRDLRARMGAPIDTLATNDPLRVAFNDLHGYSVAALTAGMFAGLVALVLIARRTKSSSQ